MMAMPRANQAAARATDVMVREVSAWYESQRNPDGSVNTNVMTVGLILTWYMDEGVPIQPQVYAAPTQVRGLSGGKIRTILAAHNETRPFTSEGGRTSRRTLPLAHGLAAIIARAASSAGYSELSPDEQSEVQLSLQRWFVDRVREDYFARQRIEAEIDPSLPARVAVARLLANAGERSGNAAGALAQHLVGAKLALRFPEVDVSNHRYTTADQQTDRPGDFTVGDTAIHVTMAPSDPLLRKCAGNRAQGFRVLVLVPDSKVQAARQLAALQDIDDRISVQAIEDFVGSNVEEMGGLDAARIRTGMRVLLETYNERVALIEPDPSIRIAIPANL